YELPDGVSFNAEASVTGHITGYEDPDENNYTKAVIESKTYNDIVFSESNLTYDGIKDILVSSDTRDSFITVTEKAVSSDFKVTIEDNFGHKITKVGDGGDVSFENIPVNDGMEITITNENLKYVPKFADVTVKQTVSGNFADMEQEFDFGTNYTSSGENDSFTGKIKATDEPKVFGSIDLGSTFTIYEKPVEGYVTTVKVNGEYITPVEGQYVDPVSGKVVENVNKVYVFTVDKDSVVEIDSCYNVEVPVGVHLDSFPYIVLAAFIFLFLLVLIVLKRRKRILTDSGI
ncbi:MAG: hypothetical protein KBT46_00085, partial [Ruminococcus sp.]|nr:hypothetical protein [Candidatus Copronaster equi]